MSALAVQVGYLAQRSVVRTLRQPAGVVFPLVFPVLLLAVNAGGLRAETHLPGFPTDSFLAFALAVPFIQGGLFATGNAGIDIAKDIQTGFLNRLALTPMRGVALLGIDSVQAPQARRLAAWQLLSESLDRALLEAMVREVGLADSFNVARDILEGRNVGRVVVDVNR